MLLARGHSFEASAMKHSTCPKCGCGGHCRNKCEVCGKVFSDKQSGSGGRPAKVCFVKCKARKTPCNETWALMEKGSGELF